ncbi:MAG: cytochrome c [Bacteroidota bacterium]|nr:cytochrome c [Bacteroidota bacterium]
MKQLKSITVLLFGMVLFFSSCQQSNVSPTSSSAYVPTASDVTASATLSQLQQGRSLFLSRCGNCHGLPSTDSYTSSNWSYIVSNMAPRAGLSSTDAALVLKYVTKGK